MKLIIISNRLPLKVVKENDHFKVIPSPGGLTTGLDSLTTDIQKCWVGWPGMYLDEPAEKEMVNKELAEHHFYPVYLCPEQIENFYEGFCNSVLWPLCHYFFSYIHYENKFWEAYKEVNALFCQEVLKIIEPDDVVWVQDYQLMLLPQMIREQREDVSIGYFHHIPFPSYELFRTLPERAEILNGLLGADLIAFHTHGYMRHFISAVYRVLKLESQLDEILLERRVVNVDAFPMGINYNLYHDAILNPRIYKKAQKYREGFGPVKLILSVDRLDYSKGIVSRLRSYYHFLKNNPEFNGKASLVMIVAPSRDNVSSYASLKDEIDKKVGSINGEFATENWTPVHYFYRSFRFEELVALYYVCDIALITPLRDGMNLVAKEYIAAKRDQPGVLILSEMAGASIELSDAIIINPNSAKEIENAIITALKMPEEEQLRSIASMQEIISNQSVRQWAEDFLEELKLVKEKNDYLTQKVVGIDHFQEIKGAYDSAEKRLILLDYDGTLVPFHKDPAKASPPSKILELLDNLNQDDKNKIVISSGRDRRTLDTWLGGLHIDLSAEHGAFYKEQGQWHQKTEATEWEQEILEIIKKTTKKTPRSKIEVKDTAIVWHYRNVDPWLAELRLNQLINALINPCSRNNLQIMKGNKIIEVKVSDVSKGAEALRLLNKNNYDFVLAIGDDITDEEMFLSLPKDAFTIKVGKHSNFAKYNLPTQNQTVHFLNNLIL